MFEKYTKLLMQFFVKRIFAEEIRLGGLKAVRAYIKAVSFARLGAMGFVGAIAAVSLIMTGFVLLIGGLLAVLGVSGAALAWVALIVGLVLTGAGVAGAILGFSEKRWLELSRSYELMDAVIEPVPTAKAVPKNMVAAFKGEPMEHTLRTAILPKPVPPPRPAKTKSMPLRPQTV